jgi:hypothetical protein
MGSFGFVTFNLEQLDSLGSTETLGSFAIHGMFLKSQCSPELPRIFHKIPLDFEGPTISTDKPTEAGGSIGVASKSSPRPFTFEDQDE